jgi:hypothetical protein
LTSTAPPSFTHTGKQHKLTSKMPLYNSLNGLFGVVTGRRPAKLKAGSNPPLPGQPSIGCLFFCGKF